MPYFFTRPRMQVTDSDPDVSKLESWSATVVVVDGHPIVAFASLFPGRIYAEVQSREGGFKWNVAKRGQRQDEGETDTLADAYRAAVTAVAAVEVEAWEAAH